MIFEGLSRNLVQCCGLLCWTLIVLRYTLYLFWFRWFVLVDVIREVLFYWLGVFIFQYVSFVAILRLQIQIQRIVGMMELHDSPVCFCQWWNFSRGFQD